MVCCGSATVFGFATLSRRATSLRFGYADDGYDTLTYTLLTTMELHLVLCEPSEVPVASLMLLLFFSRHFCRYQSTPQGPSGPAFVTIDARGIRDAQFRYITAVAIMQPHRSDGVYLLIAPIGLS